LNIFNPNQFTLKDIEKAIGLAQIEKWTEDGEKETLSNDEIIEQIQSISVINVDNNFQILSYE
jgi:hypothetical protein